MISAVEMRGGVMAQGPLTAEQQVAVWELSRQGWPFSRVARHLGRAPTTVGLYVRSTGGKPGGGGSGGGETEAAVVAAADRSTAAGGLPEHAGDVGVARDD